MKKIVVIIGNQVTEELQVQINKYNLPLTELFIYTGAAKSELCLNAILHTLEDIGYQSGDGNSYEFMTDMENLYNIVSFIYGQIFQKDSCHLLANTEAVEAVLEPVYEQLYLRYHSKWAEMKALESIEPRTYYYKFEEDYYLLEPIMGVHMVINEKGVEIQDPLADKIIYGYAMIDELLQDVIQIITTNISSSNYEQLRNIFEIAAKNRNKEIGEFEFRMFLLGIEDCYVKMSGQKDFYRIYCCSYLAIQTGNPIYLEQMNSYILRNTTTLSIYNKYFYWQQQARMFLTNMNLNDRTGNGDQIFGQVCSYFASQMKDYLIPIPKEERNKDSFIVLTVQFLSGQHAPTKTALERIYTLGRLLGKKVLVINTREKLSGKNLLPVYDSKVGNLTEEYNGRKIHIHRGYEFELYQCPCEMPDVQEMVNVLSMIREEKPYMLLTIGVGSILSELASRIIPLLNIPVGFSGIKKCENQYTVVGRTIDDAEKQRLLKNGYCIDSIIESTFTFELKEQKRHYNRSEFNLPEDEFLLLVVGIRLHHEVTDDFILAMEPLLSEGMHLVFAGHFENYGKMCGKHTVLKEHSTFIGYQDDILAINEICDLYVNPLRLGGGFSIAEAFYHGKPGVTIAYGDVAATAGSDFQVKDYGEMVRVIQKYKTDKDFYCLQSEKALKRLKVVTDSKRALHNILEEAVRRPLFF